MCHFCSYAATIGARLFLTFAKSGTGMGEVFLDIATCEFQFWQPDDSSTGNILVKYCLEIFLADEKIWKMNVLMYMFLSLFQHVTLKIPSWHYQATLTII